MERAERETLAADLFIVIGSSLVVQPAASFPLVAKENDAKLVILNRSQRPSMTPPIWFCTLKSALTAASTADTLTNRSTSEIAAMALYRIGDLAPTIHETAYMPKLAIRDVILEAGAGVWPGAVLRGDNAPIVIGVDGNVERRSAACRPRLPGRLRGVTIGHQVMLHGCTIQDGCLIGIQSVILNNAVIGEKCLVGADALVTEGKEFPHSLIIGAPAKLARELTMSRPTTSPVTPIPIKRAAKASKPIWCASTGLGGYLARRAANWLSRWAM